MMKATVEYVTVPKDSRIIAISDIHGDLSGFKKLLNKVHFTDHDSLFIVGDFCEKGSEILPLVRYVMNLSKKSNVHIVCEMCIRDRSCTSLPIACLKTTGKKVLLSRYWHYPHFHPGS